MRKGSPRETKMFSRAPELHPFDENHDVIWDHLQSYCSVSKWLVVCLHFTYFLLHPYAPLFSSFPLSPPSQAAPEKMLIMAQVKSSSRVDFLDETPTLDSCLLFFMTAPKQSRPVEAQHFHIVSWRHLPPWSLVKLSLAFRCPLQQITGLCQSYSLPASPLLSFFNRVFPWASDDSKFTSWRTHMILQAFHCSYNVYCQ